MEIMTTTEPLAKKLDQMIGGTFMYMTREVTIRDVSTADGQVKFITDGNPIIINKSELKNKLGDFLPVGEGVETTPEEVQEETLPAEMESEVATVFRQTDDKMAKLESIILENIEKVKKDKGYLEQARQVNKGVDTILKMNQQKIDLFREVRKTKLNIKK